MATLDTVIGRGPAASKPASPTEGYVYFSTDVARLERYSGSAWEVIDAGGLLYLFSTTTADADPGSGKLRFNNGTPASVTLVYIDDTPLSSDADLSTVWANVTGARVLIQQVTDDAKYILGEVTAVADGTGYYKLTVTIDDSGTLPDDGAPLALYVLGGGGGGGGGGGLSSVPWWMRSDCCIACVCQHAGTTNKYDYRGYNIAVESYSTRANPVYLKSGTRFYDASVSANQFVGFNMTSTLHLLANTYFKDLDDCDVYVGANMRVGGRTDLTHWMLLGTQSPTQHSTLGDPFGLGSISDAAVGFQARGGTDTNWQFFTQKYAGGSTTRSTTDTGVAYTDDTEYFLEIAYDAASGEWRGYINGTLVATHTDGVENTPTDSDTNGGYPRFRMGVGNQNTTTPGSTQDFETSVFAYKMRPTDIPASYSGA